VAAEGQLYLFLALSAIPLGQDLHLSLKDTLKSSQRPGDLILKILCNILALASLLYLCMLADFCKQKGVTENSKGYTWGYS
jgi:hypothetical protein